MYGEEFVLSEPTETPCLDCERIWLDYKDRVSGYIFSHVSNKEDAQDLFSTVFAKIVQAASSYRGDPNHVSSFVYRTTQNIVIDYYRGKKIFNELPEAIEAASAVEDDYFKQETLDYLAQGLEQLPKFERDIIVLHYYKNISLHKVAEQMNKSYEKIKWAHKRALEFLKSKFKNFDL